MKVLNEKRKIVFYRKTLFKVINNSKMNNFIIITKSYQYRTDFKKNLKTSPYKNISYLLTHEGMGMHLNNVRVCDTEIYNVISKVLVKWMNLCF